MRGRGRDQRCSSTPRTPPRIVRAFGDDQEKIRDRIEPTNPRIQGGIVPPLPINYNKKPAKLVKDKREEDAYQWEKIDCDFCF